MLLGSHCKTDLNISFQCKIDASENQQLPRIKELSKTIKCSKTTKWPHMRMQIRVWITKVKMLGFQLQVSELEIYICQLKLKVCYKTIPEWIGEIHLHVIMLGSYDQHKGGPEVNYLLLVFRAPIRLQYLCLEMSSQCLIICNLQFVLIIEILMPDWILSFSHV